MARMIGYRRFGGVEVLEEGSVSLPAPAEGQVLVSVRAAGINPVDYKLFGGLTRPLEVIRTIVHPSRWFARGKERPLRGVGQDFAGVVTAVGPSVSNVCVGDEVIGLLRAAPWSAREYGALATDVLTSATNVVPKPASVSFDVAGGLGVAAQTAMGAMRSVKGEAGDVIVVAAAAGGVGGLVTQLALARGATVIGIASPSNADYLRSLGAIPVSYGESLEQRIRDAAPLTRHSLYRLLRWLRVAGPPPRRPGRARGDSRSNSRDCPASRAIYRRARRKDRRHCNSRGTH